LDFEHIIIQITQKKKFIVRLLDIIVRMELELIQKANTIARGLGTIDLRSYALKNPEKWNSDFLREVLNQYQILKKMALKLPEWAATEGVLGASVVNIEQCSSAETGKHKFQNLKGKRAFDLTGGFGVDSYYLSQNYDEVIYCEINENLFQIVKNNFRVLGVSNVTFVNKSAEDYIQTLDTNFDLIYLDPDRRNDKNKKLVKPEDCSPNLTSIQSKLLKHSRTILVKYSPLLDIQMAINQIENVASVEVLAHKNEVKELLLLISKNHEVEPKILSSNISADKTELFEHLLSEEKEAESTYSEPKKYLYEPNAAILKSGAFKSIGLKFKLEKLAQHSHFYTSEELKKDFTGKIFQINNVLSYNSKVLKPMAHKKFNVIARNFPENPVTISKKHHLKDGGEDYLIFTQNHNNEKIILSCSRIF
jgi:16S rRNA G966 N2-methylase RsmD